MKFAFTFDNMRASNAFSTFDIRHDVYVMAMLHVTCCCSCCKQNKCIIGLHM